MHETSFTARTLAELRCQHCHVDSRTGGVEQTDQFYIFEDAVSFLVILGMSCQQWYSNPPLTSVSHSFCYGATVFLKLVSACRLCYQLWFDLP
jgi:hypothetical protein